MKEKENYQVGALLYCPANKESLAHSLINNRFGDKYSLALCLEDTINDKKVREAELAMEKTLYTLYDVLQQGQKFYLPKIFIRVREAEQIDRLISELGEAAQIVYGFNLPKFNLEKADGYLEAIDAVSVLKPDIKFMPIIESDDMIDIRKRADFLYAIKDKIKPFETHIPNIRVGGNDLSHLYGLRRHMNEPIYNLKPVAHALTDILSVFLPEYVVSGPVFEYYNGSDWESALRNECKMDVSMGFVGKTAIHPRQIDVINRALRVSIEDYDDAKQILNWSENDSYVKGNSTRSRMNEVKTHTNWAKRVMALADYYGVSNPQ